MAKIKLPAIKMQQTLNSIPVYMCNMPFSLLNKICKITYRTESGGKYFQRETDKAHISKIVDFLVEKMIPETPEEFSENNTSKSTIPFPTPIIIALETNINILNLESVIDKDALIDDDDSPFILEQSKDSSMPSLYTITIDEKILESSFLIVDGQHRFQALQSLEKIIENLNMSSTIDIMKFELNIMLLLEYTLVQQAEIFIDINKNQKPMNPSLVYDLFGSLPTKKIEYIFVHQLIKEMNESIKSPLYKMIKMLGKGEGIVSQAFFAETLIELIKDGKLQYYNMQYTAYQEEYNSKKSKDLKNLALKLIIDETSNKLIEYFNFIKKKYEKIWPKTLDVYLLEKKDSLSFDDSNYKKLEDTINSIKGKTIYSGYYYKEKLLKTNGFYVLLKTSNLVLKKFLSESCDFEHLFEKVQDKDFDIQGTGKSQQNKMFISVMEKLNL